MANVQDRGPPSTASIAIGTAIISGLTGYFIGQARSIGLFSFGSTSTSTRAAPEESDISDADNADSSEEEDDDIRLQEQGELKSFPGNGEECKLVFVVRTDLGMSKGS